MSDSLKPFCAEKNKKIIWRLEADTTHTATDFVKLMNLVAQVDPRCEGLFALGTEEGRSIIQSPYPGSVKLYSTDWSDKTKPRLSLLVVAARHDVRLGLREGWLPGVDLVADGKGNEYARSERAADKVRMAWIDGKGRCLVEIRGNQCTDTLRTDTRYVLLGSLETLPDTIDMRKPESRQLVTHAPLTMEQALQAQIHAARTLPGAMDSQKVWYHGMLDPKLPWPTLVRLIKGLRHVAVDFNTVELLKQN